MSLTNIDLTLDCPVPHNGTCFWCAAPSPARQLEWPAMPWAPFTLGDVLTREWVTAQRAGFAAVVIEIDDVLGHEPLVLHESDAVAAREFVDPFSTDWPRWAYSTSSDWEQRTSPLLTLDETARVLAAVEREPGFCVGLGLTTEGVK